MPNEEEKKEVPATVETPTTEVEKPTVEQDELKAKEEQKANLDKAIQEAQRELRETREATRAAKVAPKATEELPVIDDTDPSAKAWTNRIKETIDPVSSQLEKQKEEVRTFALRKFLSDKPSLARNPDKLKELMATYDRIKVATEQTQEGVLLDLDKAYGATFHEELIAAARGARVDAAKEDMIASDIAVSKGATSEAGEKPTKRQLTAEEQRIIETWEQSGAPKV